MSLKKYNTILASESWSAKDLKNSKIFSLVGVMDKMMTESNKLAENQTGSINNPISKLLENDPATRTSHPGFCYRLRNIFHKISYGNYY